MSDLDSTSGDNAPPDLPPPPDQAAWDAAAQKFQEDQLANVQKSAETWTGAIATLLGLFGTVALVAGPDNISNVSDGLVEIILVILIVGLAAGWAVVLSTNAQALPDVSSDNWNGTAYRVWVVRNAQKATKMLESARFWGLIAAALVFSTGIIVLIDAALSEE